MKKESRKGAEISAPVVTESAQAWNLLYRFVDAIDTALEAWANGESESLALEIFVDDCKEVSAAFARYLDHDAKTLDDAFGLERPKGYRQTVARERLKKARAVCDDIFQLACAGASIDNELFDAVGHIHGINRQKAQSWWTDRPRPKPPRRDGRQVDVRLIPVLNSLLPKHRES